MYDNHKITNPQYYQNGFITEKLQCIAITRHLKFSPGNAFKYIWRAGKKETETFEKDLRKALWYLNDWNAWYCITHVGGDHNEAAVIFDTIVPDGSLRYEALKCIINHDAEGAISIVRNMLEE